MAKKKTPIKLPKCILNKSDCWWFRKGRCACLYYINERLTEKTHHCKEYKTAKEFVKELFK